MSKVNGYFDSKAKALHRMRKYETAHKKYIRRKKCNNHEYGGRNHSRGLCGYLICDELCCFEYEGKIYYRSLYEHEYIETDNNGVQYMCSDGEKYKVVSRKNGFVVKADHGKIKKYHRTCAARRLRRMKIAEDSSIMRGNSYKKAYDLAWEIN